MIIIIIKTVICTLSNHVVDANGQNCQWQPLLFEALRSGRKWAALMRTIGKRCEKKINSNIKQSVVNRRCCSLWRWTQINQCDNNKNNYNTQHKFDERIILYNEMTDMFIFLPDRGYNVVFFSICMFIMTDIYISWLFWSLLWWWWMWSVGRKWTAVLVYDRLSHVHTRFMIELNGNVPILNVAHYICGQRTSRE